MATLIVQNSPEGPGLLEEVLGEHQVIKVGAAAYGIQAHMELTPEMFERWRTQDPGLRILNQWQLQRDYGILRAAYESNGGELFTNFLRIAKVLTHAPTNL